MKAQEQTGTAAPGGSASKDVVIYDGQCSLCVAQIRLLARFDLLGRLSYLSLHDSRTAQLYPDLSRKELDAQMYVVDRHSRRHGGPGAVRYLSRALPLLWPLALLLHVPGTMPLWSRLYEAVARARHRFGITHCSEEQCGRRPS
jgi:predicted DCC family thiol-disulfide oxidoreductase YuxK